jgi:hypothetical protein
MKNMWVKSHQFLLGMSVGDFYLSGGKKHTVIKRTKKKIWFDNKVIHRIGGFTQSYTQSYPHIVLTDCI